jgi:enediyne biosynthesis protein E7
VDRAQVAPLADAFADLMRGMAVNVLTSSFPQWAPRPYGRRTAGALDRILAYVDTMIAERRRAGGSESNGDLLNMLLEGRFEDGTGMGEEQIRRELVGLIIGGYETTAAVMSWVLARLPFAPDAQARAYAEVDALGGARVSHADMERLEWLRACFDEAQRLQGFPLNARQAAEDDEIGGYPIRKGTIVAVSGYAMHRDPRFWADPDAFDPRRWLEDDIDKYAFLPFGVGPRRCLGARMGYMVGLYTLATAFQRFRFAPPEGWAPAPQFSFSTIVKGGVPMTIQERSA